jgi:hypothetical protein
MADAAGTISESRRGEAKSEGEHWAREERLW